MANTLFDPTEFFGKTAHFASQGRGQFTLALPELLFKQNDARIYNARDLLQKGIMAKSVTAPGSALATFEEFSYIGPTRKQAHTRIFGPLAVDFYLMGSNNDEAQSLYYTFIKWHELIAGAQYPENSNKTPKSDSTFFAVQYYDKYVTDAEFKIFSSWHMQATEAQQPIVHNKYYELYPQNIGQLSTSWDNQDTPLTLSIEFEFYYMQNMHGKKQMFPTLNVPRTSDVIGTFNGIKYS